MIHLSVFQVLEPAFVQRVLEIAPEQSVEMPVLVHDFGNSFSKVLFYGAEFQLFMLDVLMFATVNMCTRNATVAAAVTFGVWMVISRVRDTLGEQNISRKALVDPHFLI